MSYELATDVIPGPDLEQKLDAAGIKSGVAWRPDGWIVFRDVDGTDPAAVAAVKAFMETYTPADLPPMPPSLEERVAALESKVALLESGG